MAKRKALPVIDIDALLLKSGGHSSPDEGMCVMELTSYLAHEPFSDSPACTSPVIASFLRNWNDGVNDEFRQKLKPYAAKVIGTNTGAEDEQTRAWLATDWLVRVQTPAWLDLAGLTDHAAKLRALPALTSFEIAVSVQSVIEDARKASASAAAWAAAGAAARAAARDAAGDAAGDAADAAAWAAARAAARAAASAAARDAAGAAARAAASAAARDAADQKLAPTVATLQESAFTLLDAMIAVGKPEPVHA